MPLSGYEAFWRGVAAGVVAAAALVAAAAGFVVRTGVRVEVDASALSGRVAQEMRLAAEQEVLGALEAVRSGLPRAVAEEAGRRLSQAQLNLAGLMVPLPKSAIDEAQQVLEQAVSSGLEAAVRSFDREAWAQRLGERAAAMAEERVAELLDGQQVWIELLPGLKVPVTVVLR